PANTGIISNPNEEYVELELSNKEIWIISKKRVKDLMSEISTKYTIKKTIMGEKIEGLEYINPLSKNLNLNIKNGYKVILSSRYVHADEGSGLVHCAP
ncbi:MAG: class I tRNA ligase family protein, partial [Candidatus Pacearchaeota archaeon]|nr:class I tRNA ligase family protein [Candidatus Pacearchaeota archaeon]